MIEYDGKIIQQHAERLYQQSNKIIPIQFFIGVFAGMLTAGGITALLNIGYDFLIISVGVLAGGVLGYGAGQNRAFELRLQAHMALCQKKIEENTRKG